MVFTVNSQGVLMQCTVPRHEEVNFMNVSYITPNFWLFLFNGFDENISCIRRKFRPQSTF